MLGIGKSTLPNDGMSFGDFVLLEHHVESVDAVVVVNDAAGAADLESDVDLRLGAAYLELIFVFVLEEE